MGGYSVKYCSHSVGFCFFWIYKTENIKMDKINRAKKWCFMTNIDTYILDRWNKMRTASTHSLNAGWSIWVKECLCIILATTHIWLCLCHYQNNWNWQFSLIDRFPIYNCRMMINVCFTVAFGNKVRLPSTYFGNFQCTVLFMCDWIFRFPHTVENNVSRQGLL